MKKYWVTMSTHDYEVMQVEEIDESLKDGEAKDGDPGAWSITSPLQSFLKGGVARVTLSGAYSIEVEAESEEEARRIAPMECLKKRVRDLEESLRRSSQNDKATIERHKKEIEEYRQAEKTFMSIIRSGELSLVNTGRRVIGKWYDVAGERHFDVEPVNSSKKLFEQIKGAPFKYDDCD
jgi:hypothetical protein